MDLVGEGWVIVGLFIPQRSFLDVDYVLDLAQQRQRAVDGYLHHQEPSLLLSGA